MWKYKLGPILVLNLVFWIAINLELTMHSSHHNCIIDAGFYLFSEKLHFQEWFADHRRYAIIGAMCLSVFSFLPFKWCEKWKKPLFLAYLLAHLPTNTIADPTSSF